MGDLHQLPLKDLLERYEASNVPNKQSKEELYEFFELSPDKINDESNPDIKFKIKLLKNQLIKDIKHTEEINKLEQDFMDAQNYIHDLEAEQKPNQTKEEEVESEPIKENYGETEQFLKSHRNLSFNEYVEKTKYNEETIETLKNELEKDNETYYIDFQQFNDYSLKQLEPYLKDWFETKIEKLTNDKKYLFSFKVGQIFGNIDAINIKK